MSSFDFHWLKLSQFTRKYITEKIQRMLILQLLWPLLSIVMTKNNIIHNNRASNGVFLKQDGRVRKDLEDYLES